MKLLFTRLSVLFTCFGLLFTPLSNGAFLAGKPSQIPGEKAASPKLNDCAYIEPERQEDMPPEDWIPMPEDDWEIPEETWVIPEGEWEPAVPTQPAKPYEKTAVYKAGDIITFGSYVQNGSAPEPLRWRVLDPKTGLVLSEYVIDSMPFMTMDALVEKEYYIPGVDELGPKFNAGKMYENSTVRSWLCNDFYNAAFTAEEKACIIPTVLDNGYNETTPKPEDRITDAVFLLSVSDVTNPAYGFRSDYEADTLRAGAGTGTRHAVENGFRTVTNPDNGMYSWLSQWWLRNPSGLVHCICAVNGIGEIDAVMSSVSAESKGIGVRPAMRLKFGAAGKPETLRTGDLDGDDLVTASDARLALRGAVGLEKYAPGSVEFRAADADGNNKLEAGDARLILRRAVGLIDPAFVG